MAKYDLTLGSNPPTRINDGAKAILCIHKITPPNGPAYMTDYPSCQTADEVKALLDSGYILEVCWEKLFNYSCANKPALTITSMVEV